MRTLILAIAIAATTSLACAASTWSTFIEQAAELGPEARAAAEFLTEHAPKRDTDLPINLLLDNLRLAMQARAEFPWAAQVPIDVFHNDVLPYAVFDETREPWRAAMLERVRPIVVGATTATEAAQRINRDLFDQLGVEYNTARSKTNQSPREAIAEGKATCTGLSILLVSACRAAGIPARAAGVANWADKRGNHTWVEVYDNGTWHFTGADEFTPAGLDRGWFVNDAARAIPGSREHAVWATSWQHTAHTFPMIWSPADNSVPAIDVTTRYTNPNKTNPDTADQAQLFLRVWTTAGGNRIAATVTHAKETVQTRAGTTDLNDMPALTAPPGKTITLAVTHANQTRTTLLYVGGPGPSTIDLYWDELALTEEQSRALIKSIHDELATARLAEANAAIEAKQITAAGTTMRFLEKTFGEPPPEGHALYI
ncbi:MAG: transglutaminase-like domain-containing protein, partial [Planctomycetota bacterium]